MIKKYFTYIFLTVLISAGLITTLYIFGNLVNIYSDYRIYAVLAICIYFIIWACVPIAFLLQRKERIKIFAVISNKYNLKHEYVEVKYFNNYGEFNTLSGIINNHSIKIVDIDGKPSAIHGITSQIPTMTGVTKKLSPQKTYYEIDGAKHIFSQELKTFTEIFFAKYGYASKKQIEIMLDKIKYI